MFNRRVQLALSLAIPALFAAPPTLAQSVASARPAAPYTGALDPKLLTGLRYRSIGPARGGRVTTVTGVPSQPFTFYMGSTGGGVWKTVDAGQTWVNVTDGQIGVGSMGAIDVSQSDPNTVYVGTGSDGLRSNVSIGDGIYKSTDAGKTWAHVGLRNVGNIGGLRVHPSNPDIAFVAAIGNPFRPNADRGLFRTKDGGKSWQKVLFVSDSTGAVDVELQPGNPNVVFAAMWRAERKPWTIISGAREGGIYRSADGGDTWTKVTNGLPNELVGKANIAVSNANPNRVYVLIEAKPGSGLYRSDDGGQSFQLASTFAQIITRPFYYTTITADPKNADVLYAGSEGYYRSSDAGKTWQPMRVPHGDNHDLWINPNNPDVIIQSNDGGANVSLNGGRTWSTQYNQPTAEIYQVYLDNQFPYRLYGAQQDNSTLIVPSLPTWSGSLDDPAQAWRTGPGCETGPITPHPTNPDTVYGSCKGQFSRMSLKTGQEKQYWVGAQSLYGNPGKDLIFRFQRVSPMEISPNDPRTIYYGSQYVHRTRDEGVTWERISPDLTANDPKYQTRPSGEPITIDVTGEEYYSVIYAIEESPLEPGVIWTGANDGPFYVTRDNGKTWTNVTPKAQPPGCRVQSIDPSPHRKGSAYYSVLCYQLGDFQPYIWRTDDYGRTWSRLTDGTNGIRNNEPTRVAREDPDREGLLFAGTEFGMYVSFDNGKRWQPLQLNLPATPVTDLKVHRKDLVLATQGRGFWILDDLTPLHQLSDVVVGTGNREQGTETPRGATVPGSPLPSPYLFKPREAYRFRYSAGFGGVESNRSNPADPQYPPPGAMIDYWVPNGATGPITLEVVDGSGTVIRRFSSEGAGQRDQAPDQPGMRAPEMVTVGTPRLPDAPGLNRFTWDLTLAPPVDPRRERGGRGNGPVIVPGSYTVRLAAGGKTMTQPLTVLIDPREAKDGVTIADLREQLQHNLRVRDMVTEVNQLVASVESARRRLENAGGAAADTLRRLDALRDKLVTPAVRYSKPELQAHIQYLYSMTTQADQKIGRDAIDRYKTLRAELDERQKEAKELLGVSGG
ncbi:MAG TPA: hypothetical protein VFW03_24645 [Gemmatimonadaceae bacterium]|nr:hypothetical protein [Gemmatimonadaceae bacterium]